MPKNPLLVALDLEGVLIPEIWIAVAEKTGIEKLKLTTRDVADYDMLMRGRLKLLSDHGLQLQDIQEVIGTLDPLPGAEEFLTAIRERFQVILLSDTFYEFASPLMRKLGWPTLFCNYLSVAENGDLMDYHLRKEDGKCEAVKTFATLNFDVIAAGDSYNDTTMLAAANKGILFRPTENVKREFPEFPVALDYEDMEYLIIEYFSSQR